MAVGGLGGALLAGLSGIGDYIEKARQDQLRQRDQQMRQAAFAEKMRSIKQRQDASALAWGGALGNLGDLSGLSGVGSGGAPPMPSASPQTGMTQASAPPMSGRDVGGGLRAGGALDSGNWEVAHNNFGGLRIPGSTVGPKAGGFQSFDTPEAGVSGISRQLDRYASGATTGKPLTTLRQIVSTWAPPNKNPTSQLLSRASQVTGFAPDQPLNLSDPAVKAKLIEATIRNEQGGKLPAQVNGGLIDKVAGEPQQQIAQTAKATAQNIDPFVQGRMSLQALAKQIEKTNPQADPAVKMMALEQLSKLLAPDQRMQWQIMQQQNRQDMQFALQNMRDQAASQRQDKTIEAAGARQDKTLAAKNAGGQQFTDQDVTYWANVLRNGGHLPPGLARTSAGSQLVQKIMAKIPGLGGDNPGDFIANVATVKADDRSLSNMTKMRDAAVSFERTASRNFDLALKLSKDAVPTDLGPFVNRWVMEGEKTLGDTTVPPYVTAMLTGANEYAKIMSGSTGAQGSTVDSRREAAELFSPYLSTGQIDRVVAVAKADMNNRKGSLDDQITDIKGRLKQAGSNKPIEQQEPTQGQPPGQPGGVIKLDADGNVIGQ